MIPGLDRKRCPCPAFGHLFPEEKKERGFGRAIALLCHKPGRFGAKPIHGPTAAPSLARRIEPQPVPLDAADDDQLAGGVNAVCA
jgi:hypothetical protein